ncbi:MAG: hypothetical protein M3533_11200 [Actinomycetota bacterium]|nr:hypothetical protein [Actinomycetota bacterium]
MQFGITEQVDRVQAVESDDHPADDLASDAPSPVSGKHLQERNVDTREDLVTAFGQPQARLRCSGPVQGRPPTEVAL